MAGEPQSEAKSVHHRDSRVLRDWIRPTVMLKKKQCYSPPYYLLANAEHKIAQFYITMLENSRLGGANAIPFPFSVCCCPSTKKNNVR